MSDITARERSPEEWVPDAAAQVLAEAARYGATFAAFATRPRAAAERWAGGGSDFMNPLGFVAFAAAIFWAVANGTAALWPVPGAEAGGGIGGQIASAVGLQVHYGLLGLVLHGVLRVLGSRRRAAASLGVSFYAGGSVGMALALALVVAVHYAAHGLGWEPHQSVGDGVVPLVLFVAAVTAYALLCLVLARAMIGVHGVPGWQAAAGIAVAILLTALLFGSVLPEGPYGWHPFLSVARDGGLSIDAGFRH
jgi:hypothetical protein